MSNSRYVKFSSHSRHESRLYTQPALPKAGLVFRCFSVMTNNLLYRGKYKWNVAIFTCINWWYFDTDSRRAKCLLAVCRLFNHYCRI